MQPEEAVLEPEKLIMECGVRDNHDVADFGCGPGIFSIPLAKMTEGTVYCFDVLESALEAVQSRAQIMGINNIITKRSNLEKENGSELGDGSVNHVVMRKILLQNDKKEALFRESYRILGSGGNLLVVGWNVDAVQGFGMEKKLAPEEVERFAQSVGFADRKPVDAGRYHYAFVFTK